MTSICLYQPHIILYNYTNSILYITWSIIRIYRLNYVHTSVAIFQAQMSMCCPHQCCSLSGSMYSPKQKCIFTLPVGCLLMHWYSCVITCTYELDCIHHSYLFFFHSSPPGQLMKISSTTLLLPLPCMA